MKHLGKYGFTYDSKAEEWAAWAIGCWEHDPPRTERLRDRHAAMTWEYWNEAATEVRHSPAQQQNTIGVGGTTSQHRQAPLWPVLALSVVSGIIAIVLVWG